jgi:DNA-directed RNA polymerase specialized sigma24 family protein
VRLVTNLGSFERRSRFMTWAYTLAVRQLMRTRKRQIESSVIGAETFAAFLDQGLADRDFTAEEAEYRLLCAEVRISCTEELRAGQRESGYADHRAALDELIAGAALLAAPALII